MVREPWLASHPCPQCGGNITIDTDCPGYASRQGVGAMVCHPPCGNAFRFDCAKACGWWYRLFDGGVRKSTIPMAARPDWMSEYEKSLSFADEDE